MIIIFMFGYNALSWNQIFIKKRIHIHTHICTYTCMWCAHTQMLMHPYICIHTHTYSHTHVHRHTFTRICLYVYKYTPASIHNHIPTSAHTYTYTHRLIHLYIHTHMPPHTQMHRFVCTFTNRKCHLYITSLIARNFNKIFLYFCGRKKKLHSKIYLWYFTFTITGPMKYNNEFICSVCSYFLCYNLARTKLKFIFFLLKKNLFWLSNMN